MPPRPAKGLPASLAAALAAYQGQGLAAGLEAVYQALPATQCQRQGHCCGLLPSLAPLEMLAWLDWLGRQATRQRAEQVSALLEHFLANAAQRRPCPWAGQGACAIYERRFFACRAYGLWPPAAYQGRRQAALMAQEAVARAWAGLGVSLPAEVLAPGPDYCRQVRAQGDGENLPRGAGWLESREAELDALARSLPTAEDLAQAGGDLSYLLARVVLGVQACLGAKVALTKALLAGQAGQARQILDQAQGAARAWAAAWPETRS